MVRVSVVHLDLGIGGAERLVVNTSIAMKELGHEVEIFTTHHDKTHCFEETKEGGVLADHVWVYGDWLPRQLFKRGTAFFSVLRMLYLTLVIVLLHAFRRKRSEKEHVVFIDGVSAPIPLFKFMGLTVIFYCHFPDKLLVISAGGPLKRAYRYLLDWLEENSTGCADLILCNSTFTAHEFRLAFRNLGATFIPSVLNPTVENDILVEDYLEKKKVNLKSSTSSANSSPLIAYTHGADFVFLSLNRFERAKRVEFALGALKLLKDRIATNYKNKVIKVILVVAGGYDPQVLDNELYLKDLQTVARQLNIEDDVVFRTSIGKEERFALLSASSALVYTPSREHFGIVPIEAMALGTPVIAVASGGPLETINEGATGFLCAQSPLDFANNMMRFIIDPNLSLNMAEKCRLHVERNFTGSAMKKKLEVYMRKCVEEKNNPRTKYYVRKFAFQLLRSDLHH